MPKKRNFTRELLTKRAKGDLIVVSLSPYFGVPAVYDPRSTCDPSPWDAGLPYRFSGRECHAVKPERVTQFNKDEVLRLIGTLFDGAFEMGQDDLAFDYTVNQQVNILAALVAEEMLERRGASYILTHKGYNHLTDNLGIDTTRLAYV